VARKTDADLTNYLDALSASDGNAAQAARAMGVPRQTFNYNLKHARSLTEDSPPTSDVEFPQFPNTNPSAEEILAWQCKRYEKLENGYSARKWYDIKINVDGPIGVSFFGDPHIDDNGCNTPMLMHHCEIHARTEALFGVNCGDTTNNWVGRLGRLFADQDSSQETARLLANWLLSGSGVTWLAWILGNHDLWNDGEAILRAMNGEVITERKEKFPGMEMAAWQARFGLVFPNKRRCRVWMSHDFPGHSQWNSLHGAMKAAKMKDQAHIYACGHKHNAAMFNEENAERDFTYWLVRAKGYKDIDSYGVQLGHDTQKSGHSITAIIDPSKPDSQMVQCFQDMELAADFLTFLRKKK